MFYTKVKKHISPSAVAKFYESKTGFIKTYFEGEKVDNEYTRRGKNVHSLIEGGFYEPAKKFDEAEKKIEVKLDHIKRGLKGLGFIDSYQEREMPVEGYGTIKVPIFVDYKTASYKTAENWDEDRVRKDLKQKTYAYFLHLLTGAKMVRGYIEVIAVNEEGLPEETYNYFSVDYTEKDFAEMEEMIKKMVKEVNRMYKDWKEQKEVEVDEEVVAEYLEAVEQEKMAKAKKNELAKIIVEKVKEAGAREFEMFENKFYLKPYVRYEYDPDIEVEIDGEKTTLGELEKRIADLADIVKVVKENNKHRAKVVAESYTIGISKIKK